MWWVKWCEIRSMINNGKNFPGSVFYLWLSKVSSSEKMSYTYVLFNPPPPTTPTPTPPQIGFPHQEPVMYKMFPCQDVIMMSDSYHTSLSNDLSSFNAKPMQSQWNLLLLLVIVEIYFHQISGQGTTVLSHENASKIAYALNMFLLIPMYLMNCT